MKKFIMPIISAVLICCCLVGTTYAWIVAKADPIINTFTAGNINISLSDTTTRNMTMVPGVKLTENSKAIVRANSEACWLFIKVKKTNSFDAYMECEMDSVWTKLALENNPGYEVYYREVASSDTDQNFDVLESPYAEGVGDEILVKPEVTKAQLEALNTHNYPTLTFTAYAVQRLKFETAAAAWVEAEKLDNTSVHSEGE